MELSPTYKMARTAYRAGLCVVPPKGDGTKAPISSWKAYQTERSTPQQIDEWYENGRDGIGIVCGAVSGNLTMLECENGDIWQLLRDNAEGTGLGELLKRVADGWMERTPGGGIHIYYRCEDCRGNKKLARRPGSEKGKIDVLIETRGEGGYTIIAPSGGVTHPSGGSYVLVGGGPRTIATITVDEQRDLWQLCQVFDEIDVVKAEEPTYVGLLRPGDDYNNRATWREILEPHGWRFLFERGGTWYLRRPGKDRGVSATVNWGGFDCLRNFSSSTPLDERMYSKFGVYTILNHRGDFREAAKTLARDGFGSRDRAGEEEGAHVQALWRTPDALERPGFPSFPVHRLPMALRGFCKAVSESVQVPYDYPAMTMLGALSVAARGRYEVVVDGTNHREPLVLQTVLFAESGTRKSNSFAIVKKPLVMYEREQRKLDEVELSAWEIRHGIAEKQLADAKRKGHELEVVLHSMAQDLEKIRRERPRVTRLIADDVTPERLGTIIAEQGGPIGVMAPEGGFFGNISGRYNQGIPNMEYVLRGHAGEPLIIDRMGRESMVPAAYVTLAISLQPDIVNELSAVPGFRGKGMAARLLPSFPVSPVGSRDIRKSKAVPHEEEVTWNSIITTILNETEMASASEWGEYSPYALSLGRDARELYYLYSEHVERQLAKGGGLSTIRDWGGKMVGHALRIAGLFHLVECGTEAPAIPIAKQSLADAISVMEYFVPHAKYLLERLSGVSYGEHLDELMNVLRGLEEPIYKTQVTGKLRTHRVFKGNLDYITESLDELELLGYIRIIPEGKKVRVELNPSIGGAINYTSFDVPDILVDDWTFTYQGETDEDW